MTTAKKKTVTKSAKRPGSKSAAKASAKLHPVIVRTYSAGAHFGYLVARNGKEVQLTKSRRIWQWQGAWTLSEIATSGLDAARSKVGAPVDITITEAIEIIVCTEKGAASVESATWAK